MGQKANKITLQSKVSNLSLLSVNPSAFLNFYNLLRSLERLLFLKGILITSEVLNLSSNGVALKLNLFYKSAKLTQYKKGGLIQQYSPPVLSLGWLKALLHRYAKQYRFNYLLLSIAVSNSKVNTSALSFLYSKLRRFLNTIFTRRFNLFIDFLKLTQLFISGHLSTKQFIIHLGSILKVLSKKSHNRYIFFIKYLFKLLLSPSSQNRLQPKILGLKFIMHGRIAGKEKASSRLIQGGAMPSQTIEANISFARAHVYTVYGAIGLQLWVLNK